MKRHGWMVLGALGLLAGCASESTATIGEQESALAASAGEAGAACLDGLVACFDEGDDLAACRDGFVGCIDEALATEDDAEADDSVADADEPPGHHGHHGPGEASDEAGDSDDDSVVDESTDDGDDGDEATDEGEDGECHGHPPGDRPAPPEDGDRPAPPEGEDGDRPAPPEDGDVPPAPPEDGSEPPAGPPPGHHHGGHGAPPSDGVDADDDGTTDEAPASE